MTGERAAVERARRLASLDGAARLLPVNSARTQAYLAQLDLEADPMTETKTESVTLRLPSTQLERIDALADDYILGPEAEAMGARMTRSKLLRLLLTKGAEAVEAEQAQRRLRERERERA